MTRDASQGAGTSLTKYAPDALGKHVEQIAVQSGGKAFVIGRSHKRHREMWCACRFATGYAKNFEPCEVEIEEDDEQADYDFKLCIASEALKFQVAEVMEEGLRRGEVYRDLSEEEIQRRNSGVPRNTSEELGEQVHAAVERKLAKYGRSPDLHILLYLNVHAPSAPWALLSTAIEESADSFGSVWAHTQHAMICLYGGNRWHGEVRWRMID
jgi:hypothetical protein